MSKTDRPSPGRSPAPEASKAPIVETIVWIGSIAGTGIIGNAAWDAIKTTLRRASGAGARRAAAAGTLGLGPETKIGRSGPLRSLLDYTARASVIVQSKEHDLPVPKFKDLRVSGWKRGQVDGREVFSAEVKSRFESPFRAVVHIPVDDLDERGVEVTIHRAITWETVVEIGYPE